MLEFYGFPTVHRTGRVDPRSLCLLVKLHSIWYSIACTRDVINEVLVRFVKCIPGGRGILVPLEDIVLPFLLEDVMNHLIVGSKLIRVWDTNNRGRWDKVVAEEPEVGSITSFRICNLLPISFTPAVGISTC